MQIFTPFADPYLTAEAMINDKPRLRKQVIECSQILDAIDGKKKGWANHPITKMYAEHYYWVHKYQQVLELYLHNDFNLARIIADEANEITPPFLTDEFCDNHKRRLYTKAPQRYPQFALYGVSYENWYVVGGEVKVYRQENKLMAEKQ